MGSFKNSQGRAIAEALVKVIDENAALLSEIDGAIGDGDHGINMRKGFLQAQKEFGDGDMTVAEGLSKIGNTLLVSIGGAMGPLYGSFFIALADACEDEDTIDSAVFDRMLSAGLEELRDLGEAKVGDKTLMDTLIPAQKAYSDAVTSSDDFAMALEKMSAAAEQGKESTRDLVAKVGRASRLGERSKGHLDAGATSCYLILKTLADEMTTLIE